MISLTGNFLCRCGNHNPDIKLINVRKNSCCKLCLYIVLKINKYKLINRQKAKIKCRMTCSKVSIMNRFLLTFYLFFVILETGSLMALDGYNSALDFICRILCSILFIKHKQQCVMLRYYQQGMYLNIDNLCCFYDFITLMLLWSLQSNSLKTWHMHCLNKKSDLGTGMFLMHLQLKLYLIERRKIVHRDGNPTSFPL